MVTKPGSSQIGRDRLKTVKALPTVSVVIVNYNGRHLLQECFDSLLKIDYPRKKLEILMVDNGSKDQSVRFVRKEYKTVKVLFNKENNYCGANNLAISKAKGNYVALLNNDTIVEKDWLLELVLAMLSDEKIAIAGGKVYFPNGTLQSTGHIPFPHNYWADRGFHENDKGQYDTVEFVDSVSNCAALYRKKAFHLVGGLDEDFGMYMEDTDIATRLRQKGWKICYIPKSVVHHRLHGSGQEESERRFYIEKNRLLLAAKHQPEKLIEFIYGTGEINQLSKEHFEKLFVSLFDKILKSQRRAKALELIHQVQEELLKIKTFQQHCNLIEAARKTGELTEQIKKRGVREAERDRELADKQNLIQQLNSELAFKEEALLQQRLEAERNQKVIQEQAKLLKEGKEQVQNLEKALTAGRAKERELQRQLELFKEKNFSYREKISFLSQGIESLNVEIQEGKKSILGLKEELVKNENEKSLLSEQKQLKEDERLKLEKQVEGLRYKLEHAKKEIKLKEKLGQRETKLAQSKEQLVEQLEERLKDKASEEERLQKTLQEFSQKNDNLKTEIFQIYNSETHRFIIKPFIWPISKFGKRLTGLFKKEETEKKVTGWREGWEEMSVGHFYAGEKSAVIFHPNEYFFDIVNDSYQEKKIKIVFDIYPILNPSHPQRHFGFFTIQIPVLPESASSLEIRYDWHKNLEIFLNKKKIKDFYFWQGDMNSFEKYQISLQVYNLSDNLLDELKIYQELKK